MLMSFNGSVLSDDFCEAFRAEGNRINYLYKQELKSVNYFSPTIHMIINGKSWDLMFDPVKRNLTFNTSVSQLAPVFTNQYMGAACFWIGGPQGKCDTMLFPKRDTIYKVNVTRIANNDHKDPKPLKEFSQPEERTIYGLPQRKYLFVFSNSHENKIELVVGPTPGNSFTQLYYTFRPNGDKGFNASEYHFPDPKDESNVTKDFNMDKEVIGIWNFRYLNAFLTWYIVLLKDNQLVYWCRTYKMDEKVCMTKKTVSTIYSLTSVSVQRETPDRLYRHQSRDHSRWRSSPG